MAPTTLDHMLDSYLLVATEKAQTVACSGKCLAYTKFNGEDISGQGESRDAALSNLRELIRQRVHRAMTLNRPLPVIAGMEITPGSC